MILHDFVLYYLITGYYLNYLKSNELYLSELYYNYGDNGIRAAKEVLTGDLPPLQYNKPGKLPLVRRVVENAKGIIVHSEYAKKMVLQTGICNPHVEHINQINYNNEINILDDEIKRVRAKYGVTDDEILVASFGYIAPTKRNYQVIKAINEIQTDQNLKVKYLMVGEGDYVDACLNEKIMKTGYISIHEFEKLIHCVDIVVNLRYPSMGETSATLLRAMTAGKACIVSDDAWFSELPDEVVVKVPIEEEFEKPALKKAIENLVRDKVGMQGLGSAAKEYVLQEHDPDLIAQKISSFISKDRLRSFTTKYLDTIADKLIQLGITEENGDYLKFLSKRIIKVL